MKKKEKMGWQDDSPTTPSIQCYSSQHAVHPLWAGPWGGTSHGYALVRMGAGSPVGDTLARGPHEVGHPLESDSESVLN